MSTELAGDTNGVFWPLGMWVGGVVVGLVGFDDHNVLLTLHHRLDWGHHHWLALILNLLILHRLSRSSRSYHNWLSWLCIRLVHRLRCVLGSHLLRSIHWCLTYQWLCLAHACDLTIDRILVSNFLAIHLFD